MEHFCTLFIFRGLFFQLFGHFVYANSYRKTDILQNREIYSIYEDNRQRKIARTKGKLFSYLGIIKLTSRLDLKFYLTTIFKSAFQFFATHFIKTSFTIFLAYYFFFF